ncbi:SCAN domain-containing protein 3-like [Hydra vulgaris]|uniref:SCAN domain-containing protein 3-like n=1 Tax=Hydra vulgaris TaxID=6087 RepID=A0ABM4D1N9_HYDVU
MSKDVEIQLIEKLKTRLFSMQMDESRLRDSEAGKGSLVAKNISPVQNKIMNLVVKCINSIKASAKQERILKLLCEENNEAHVRLLLHTEVRWLSKENCLKRFIELFDTLSDFLSDKTEMQYLLTINSKAYLSYLTDIFEKLNILNKEIQGTNKTLVDATANIFADLKGRFSDLKEIDFPTWLMQPMLVNLSHISNMQYQEQLAEMQNDESVKILFNMKGSIAWFFEETKAECGFSAITDLLLKKRNHLDITQRRDLKMKLTKLEPNIKSFCYQYQAQGSH